MGLKKSSPDVVVVCLSSEGRVILLLDLIEFLTMDHPSPPPLPPLPLILPRPVSLQYFC